MSASDVVFRHDVHPFTSSGVCARVQAPTRCLRCALRCAHEALVFVVEDSCSPLVFTKVARQLELSGTLHRYRCRQFFALSHGPSHSKPKQRVREEETFGEHCTLLSLLQTLFCF